MPKEKIDLNIRSEEVQDIMQKTPSSIIRNGLSAMFILLMITILLSYFIKYPDVISGNMVLTTANEPIKIVSQSSGNIKQLLVKDGEFVKAGTILAEIENPLSARSVDYMRKYLINLEIALSNNSSSFPFPDTTIAALGDLQSTVNGLWQELMIHNATGQFKMDDVEMASLHKKIENQKELIRVNQNIIAISNREFENAKIKYESDKKLFKDSVISKMDFFAFETNYRTKELALEKLYQTQVEYKNILTNLELQISQTSYNKFTKGRSNMEAIRGFMEIIRSYVYGWQQKYNLTAINSGTVNFLKRIHVGYFLKSGEELFAITQPGEEYIGIAKIPAIGFGKIKVGQEVHILLQSFPYYDYGMLEGKVKTISMFPESTDYRVEIAMPNGMMSTQKQVIKFSPEMIGEAEIITEDKRIIERLFASVTKAMKRKK